MINLGRLGIWTAQFDFVPASTVQQAARELEQLGYGAIWFGENIGRETVSQSSLVLAATEKIVMATGVQNIMARDPLTTVAGQNGLSEAYPDRYLLGLGPSHARLGRDQRNQTYERPLATVRQFLTDMDELDQKYRAVRPEHTYRVLGALGPKMLALASEMTDGAHPYFVPPEHTAQAREILGPDKLLAVEQAIVLETDVETARATARRHTRRFLPLVNYTNNLRRLGFTDADFENEGSDRLVDAIVAWGDLDAIAKRLREHWDAGADHVCLNVVSKEFRELPLETWRELAGIAG